MLIWQVNTKTSNNKIIHSKLVISVTECLVEVVDKLLYCTTVVFFRTTVVVESLSTTSTRCSVIEITSLLQDSTNRMRNLHQNNPNPAGISDPITVTYIPVCKNSVQAKSISSVDSSFVLKGMIC